MAACLKEQAAGSYFINKLGRNGKRQAAEFGVILLLPSGIRAVCLLESEEKI